MPVDMLVAGRITAPTSGSGGSGQARAKQDHRRRLRDRRWRRNLSRDSRDAARGVRVEEQRVAKRQVVQCVSDGADHQRRVAEYDPRVAAIRDERAGERAEEIAGTDRRCRLVDS